MPSKLKLLIAPLVALLSVTANLFCWGLINTASANDGLAGVQAVFDSKTTDDSMKVAVAIKGGGSLGNYEAGVSWGLLRILKEFETTSGSRVELLAAAGASAGALNGLMSAVYWCGDDLGLDTIDANVISDAWRRVDVSDLLELPPDFDTVVASKGLFDSECAQADQQPIAESDTEDNGVFSRRIFRKTQDTLQCMMQQPLFREGCSVAVGLTLTRADAVQSDNAGIAVGNQRLVVPLRMAEVDNGRFSAHRLELESEDQAFNRSIIHLDVDSAKQSDTGRVSAETLFQAVKGSSSFPVAFAPIKLDYCLRYLSGDVEYLKDYSRRGYDGRCPEGFRRLTSYFVDGGVFDNDPISLIRHLAEDNGADVGEVLYVNIDPGRRRQSSGRAKVNVTPFNQPGDSIEVELLSGRQPSLAATDQSGFHADGIVCDSNNNPLAEFELPLYETGPQKMRYVGVLHTCDDCSDDGILRTEPDQRIRLFPHDSPVPAHCNPGSQEDRVSYSESAVVDEEPQGLSTQLGFVIDAVDSGRNAALYSEIVGQSWADGFDSENPIPGRERPLFQPARLTPLTGEYLASFGAFLERRFRDFDYYAGVYDAVYGIAEFYCDSEQSLTETCLAETFANLYLNVLCPECKANSTAANVVIRHLVKLDVCGIKAAVDPNTQCNVSATPWAWVDSIADDTLSTVTGTAEEGCSLNQQLLPEPPLSEDLPAGIEARNELLAIGRALACADIIERELDRDPFRAFIQHLALDPRFDRESGSALGRMLAKSERPASTWYYPLANATVKKLLPLETRDQQLRTSNNGSIAPGSGGAKTGLAVAGLAAESIMADRIGWQPHLSSIPPDSKWDKYAPFLPNEIAAETRSGGLDFYWEAGWRSHSRWGAIARVAPYLRQKSGEQTIEFSEASLFLTYSLNDVFLSSGGVGPTYTHTWSDLTSTGQSGNWGASAYIGLLGDKLRLTYGKRSFSSNGFAGDDFYWQISVRDIPGFIYWGVAAQ